METFVMARVPYCYPEEFDGDRDLLASSMDDGDIPTQYSHLYSTEFRHVHRAIANNPSVLDAFRTYNGRLWSECELSDRERELVILTVANESKSEYEWHQHVRHALAVGVEEEAILDIEAGESENLNEQEDLLVTYTRALVERRVDDALHKTFEERSSRSTVVGTVALAAAYIGLAHLLDALSVTPEEPFVGWNLEGL